MDNLVRFAALLTLGAILLLGNIWYLRTLVSFFYSNEYVIMPIRLLGKEDKDGTLGIGLAQMLQRRLKYIEQDLADSQQKLSIAESQKPIASESKIQIVSQLLPASAMVLPSPLFRPEAFKMPTSLLQPVNINVSVGGVSVSGVVAWIQNLLVEQRTLNFTIEVVDKNRIIVGGDVTPPFSGGDNGSVWFESDEPEDKVISRLAYMLLLKHLTSVGGKSMEGLISVDDFKALAVGLHQTGALNQEIARGEQPGPKEFADIFHNISPISLRALGWPELKYFAANLAERANENKQAVILYTQFKDARSSPDISAEALKLINSGTIDVKIASLSTSSTKGTKAGEFDMPVTKQGSTEHAVVYYETTLGATGSEIAQAILASFEGDFAKLVRFFGGLTPPKPFSIIVAAVGGAKDGSGGAYHSACMDEVLYVDVKAEPTIDADLTKFFTVAEAVDVFIAVQNKGWDCGDSSGEALTRVLRC